MINPVVEISQDDVTTLMAKLEAATRDEDVISGMTDGAIHMKEWIQANRLTNGPLFIRSGLLRNSIFNSTIEKSGDTYQGKIGIEKTKASIYGPVHEYGMTIHAKNKPYLCFQIQTGTRFMSLRGGARLKHPVALSRWVKVKSVTIPARPFMKPAAEEKENINYLVEAISERLTKEIAKANS